MITKNKAFTIGSYIMMALMVAVVLIPFWLLIISSFTPESEIIQNGYALWPSTLTLDTYRYLWTVKDGVARAYLMSIIISTVGVTANIALTTLFAYPLSRKDLPGRKAISFFLFFTMLFNGGLVPTYMVYTRLLHITDTVWAMIVPTLMMNAFNVIMMRTYITSSISNEIIEAARIDGAAEGSILVRVVLPLCKPIIATLGLMSFIAYWNNWTNGVYYVPRATKLWGIQNYLNNVIEGTAALTSQAAQQLGYVGVHIPTLGVKMALAVIAVLPVLVIYPFFQKYFVKGIMIGSVKG